MADTLVSPLHVEIITPDGPIYTKDGATMVVARAVDGEFAVMKNHLPLAAALRISPVRIKSADGEEEIAVFGGFLEMADNCVNIIAPLAELASTIDVARAEAARKRAEERLAHRTADLDVERAIRALQRALTRLHVAGKL